MTIRLFAKTESRVSDTVSALKFQPESGIEGTLYHGTYESLDEYISVASDATIPRWGDDSRKDHGNGWCPHDFDECIDLVRMGWPAGREKMSDAVDIAGLCLDRHRAPKFKFDVAGFRPDINRYNAGVPDCMIDARPGFAKRRPVIRVMYNFSASCKTTDAQILNRGAALLSYVDKLENAGTQVEIIALGAANARGESPSTLFEFVAKQAGEPVDLDRMAFVLLHSGLLRRFNFAHIEQIPALADWSQYYGRPRDLSQFERDSLCPEGAIYIPALTRGEGAKWNNAQESVGLMAKIFETGLGADSESEAA